MKIERFLIISGLVGLMALSASCKKDDDTVSLPDFSGTLGFECPSYVAPGQTVTVTPEGAYRDDGGSYGYYWYVNPTQTARDTTRYESDPLTVTGSFSFTVPDTLCTLSIVCNMYASGYTNASATNQTVIVKDESLSGIYYNADSKLFKDERDGKEYKYVTVGGLDWMQENLSYDGLGVSMTYFEPLDNLFGRYYTWEEAAEACPEGWRIPTMDDWKTLCGGVLEGGAGSLMVNAYFNGDRMWEYWPDVKISNSSKMNAIPTGYGYLRGDKYTFGGVNSYAVWWTSEVYDADQGLFVTVNKEDPDMLIGNASRDSFAATVRCVRDHKE